MVAPKGPGSNRRYVLVLLPMLLALAGCDTLHFYQQAVAGQLQLLQDRTKLARLMDSPDLDETTAQRLNRAQDILTFASDSVGLQQDGRYTSYVALQRDFVVWNVFAAQPFDLAGKHWCYPIVGCAPYRGYFRETDALAAARKYQSQGYETYVGGVPAYSTLGWFDDPLLDTFLLWPDAELASLLIHELAHGRVWVRNDVAFNESFAEFVGLTGAQQWLQNQGLAEDWRQSQQRRGQWRRFRSFIVQAKAHLQMLYEQVPADDMIAAKRVALDGWQACYAHNKDRLGQGRFDSIMASQFNNAFLISVGTYADYLPGFAALYRQVGGQWPLFFTEVGKLAELDSAARQSQLELLAEQQEAHTADDKNAEQINCKTFLSHSFYGEAAG